MKRFRIIPKSIKFISLVSNAANDLECFKLSKQPKKMLQVFYGVVARPGYPMLRVDESGPYEVYFEPEDIEYMMTQFEKVNSFDIEHNNKIIPVKILKQFITNSSNSERFDTEPGSWVMAIYIDDPSIWDKILSNIINGFSPEIEGELIDQDLTLSELLEIIK